MAAAAAAAAGAAHEVVRVICCCQMQNLVGSLLSKRLCGLLKEKMPMSIASDVDAGGVFQRMRVGVACFPLLFYVCSNFYCLILLRLYHHHLRLAYEGSPSKFYDQHFDRY